MGSTATEDAPARAPGEEEHNSGKAGSVKKAVSRKTRSRKKSPGKKTVTKDMHANGETTGKATPAARQSAGKARTKARRAAPNPAQKEQPAPATGSETGSAHTAAAADKPATDSRSISWMSAQAVSALNAVKANQAKKAEALLARVEKPVPGKPGITELPEQTSEDLIEEFPGMEMTEPVAAPLSTAQEPPKTSAAATGDTPAVAQKETIVMQDKPDTQETAATEAAGNTPEVAATTSSEPGATASTEAIIAEQARPRGLPVRPIVMTAFLALLAFSGYRYWQENRDSGVTAPPVAGSFNERVQGATWDDIPKQEAIAVVGTASGEQAEPVAKTPDTAAGVAVQQDTAETGEPAATAAMETPGPAIQAIPREPETVTAEPAVDAAPPPADRAETQTAEPAELTTSEPPPPETTTVVTQPARPVQPQPGYGAPGYGYYPRQPNWQQPYYQPAYPQQYPAR
jgi:hypothetical protein